MGGSTIGQARQVVYGVYMRYGASASMETVVRESLDKMRDQPGLLTATARYGVERLFGEIERQREKGTRLRRGERARGRQGEQLSLPLLAMTFAQARETNTAKYAHAQGALAEARFETKIIDIAAERARERGIDPFTTTMVIGQFIDPDEIAQLRKAA